MLRAFFRLFYPKLCAGCNTALRTNESHICTICRLNLPETLYGFDNTNPVAKTFWGRLPLEGATSLLHFQKGSVIQKILHELKYNHNKHVGIELGHLLGGQLKLTMHTLPDVLVPVPLHPKRLRERGYNQSEMIAMGIHEATGVPIELGAIKRNTHTKTQTKKGRESRWDNVAEIFSLTNPEKLEGKYVLLVDDVLTTGATLEACGSRNLAAPNVKLAIATVAYA
jgi:ComF family protein